MLLSAAFQFVSHNFNAKLLYIINWIWNTMALNKDLSWFQSIMVLVLSSTCPQKLAKRERITKPHVFILAIEPNILAVTLHQSKHAMQMDQGQIINEYWIEFIPNARSDGEDSQTTYMHSISNF